MSNETSSSRLRNRTWVIAVIVVAGIFIASFSWIVLPGERVFSQTGCCGKGCGSGGPQSSQAAPQLSKTDAAIKAALTYYQQKYGDSAVSATAKDYGCHIEVTIVKEGQPIKTLTYVNGQIYE